MDRRLFLAGLAATACSPVAADHKPGHRPHPHLTTTTTMPTTTTRLHLQEWPGPSNTGVPAGTSLTPNAGNYTTVANGEVVDALEIQDGAIVIAHDNVTIRRCLISMNSFIGIYNPDVHTGIVVDDCEVDGNNVLGSTGIDGRNITVRRCNVHHVENGFSVSTNTDMRDCWVHDMIPYTVQDDPHIDGVQYVEGASNIAVVHNNFEIVAAATSCVNVWNGTGTQVSNCSVLYNKIEGGGFGVYGPRQAGATNTFINYNRFIRDSFEFGPEDVDPQYVTEFIGNVYDDNGDPI